MRLWIIFISLFICFGGLGGCCHSPKEESNALKQSVYSRCEKKLVESLKSETLSFWPRMHAAEALTDTGNPDIVLQLLPAMLADEEDDQKRCGLVRELIRAGDESKVGVLTEILATPKSTGRVHSAESLFKLKRVGDVERMFEYANDSSNPRVQMWTCAALIRTGHKEYLPALRGFLSSQDPLERALSAYILGQLNDRKMLNQIKTNMEQVCEPLNSFFYTAGLVYMGDPEAIGKLQYYLNYEDESIRALAAYTAGSAFICDYQQTLVTLLDDPMNDVQIRSAHALLSMQ